MLNLFKMAENTTPTEGVKKAKHSKKFIGISNTFMLGSLSLDHRDLTDEDINYLSEKYPILKEMFENE